MSRTSLFLRWPRPVESLTFASAAVCGLIRKLSPAGWRSKRAVDLLALIFKHAAAGHIPSFPIRNERSIFIPGSFAEWAAKAIQCATTGLYDEESYFQLGSRENLVHFFADPLAPAGLEVSHRAFDISVAQPELHSSQVDSSPE